MPVRVRLTLAPLVLLVITACGTSDASGTPDVTEAAEIKVEVDVMSGVPNPTLDGARQRCRGADRNDQRFAGER